MHYGKRFTKVNNKFLIFPMHEIESFFGHCAYLDLCSPASAMALFSNFASN